MADEWILVAQSSDGDQAHAIEMIRPIGADELAVIDAAQSALSSLTSRSPYQRAVDASEALQAALAELGPGVSTESETARRDRLAQAFDSFRAACLSAPADLIAVLAELGVDPSDMHEAADELRARQAWRLLGDEQPDWGTFRWVMSESGPEAVVDITGAGPIRLGPFHAALMNGLVVLMSRALIAAAGVIDERTRVVRALEAEALFGRAALARVLPESEAATPKFQLRGLPSDIAAAAQAAVRRARAVVESARPSMATGPSGPGDADAASSVTESDADDELKQVGASVAEGPSTSPDETPEPLSVPVDLWLVARHIADQLTEVERAYGELPGLDELLRAADTDGSAVGSFMRQLSLAVEQERRKLEDAGVGSTTMNLPLTADDLGATTLRDDDIQASLRQDQVAEVLLLEETLAALELLRQPAELSLAAEGRIESVRFDPGAASRLRSLVRQLGRAARRAGETVARAADESVSVDGQAEREWLNAAIAASLDNGLHEAALMYMCALAGCAEPAERSPAFDDEFLDLARATVAEVANGRTASASAAAIVLTRWVRQHPPQPQSTTTPAVEVPSDTHGTSEDA